MPSSTGMMNVLVSTLLAGFFSSLRVSQLLGIDALLRSFIWLSVRSLPSEFPASLLESWMMRCNFFEIVIGCSITFYPIC